MKEWKHVRLHKAINKVIRWQMANSLILKCSAEFLNVVGIKYLLNFETGAWGITSI